MKKTKRLNIIFVLTTLCTSLMSFGQDSVYVPDLSTINDSTKWGNFDRDVRFDSVVIFAAKASEGPIWLKNYSFQNGKIDVDLKGKNLQGQSFVGVAFHLIDGNKYDAIYFRPFIFLISRRNTL